MQFKNGIFRGMVPSFSINPFASNMLFSMVEGPMGGGGSSAFSIKSARLVLKDVSDYFSKNNPETFSKEDLKKLEKIGIFIGDNSSILQDLKKQKENGAEINKNDLEEAKSDFNEGIAGLYVEVTCTIYISEENISKHSSSEKQREANFYQTVIHEGLHVIGGFQDEAFGYDLGWFKEGYVELKAQEIYNALYEKKLGPADESYPCEFRMVKHLMNLLMVDEKAMLEAYSARDIGALISNLRVKGFTDEEIRRLFELGANLDSKIGNGFREFMKYVEELRDKFDRMPPLEKAYYIEHIKTKDGKELRGLEMLDHEAEGDETVVMRPYGEILMDEKLLGKPFENPELIDSDEKLVAHLKETYAECSDYAADCVVKAAIVHLKLAGESYDAANVAKKAHEFAGLYEAQNLVLPNAEELFFFIMRTTLKSYTKQKLTDAEMNTNLLAGIDFEGKGNWQYMSYLNNFLASKMSVSYSDTGEILSHCFTLAKETTREMGVHDPTVAEVAGIIAGAKAKAGKAQINENELLDALIAIYSNAKENYARSLADIAGADMKAAALSYLNENGSENLQQKADNLLELLALATARMFPENKLHIHPKDGIVMVDRGRMRVNITRVEGRRGTYELLLYTNQVDQALSEAKDAENHSSK